MFDLKNKVILITGGTGLLGSEFASTLSHMGANVVLGDLNLKTCKKKAKALELMHGNKTLGLKLDVSKKTSVTAAFNKIEQTFGKIDVLINNAAFNCPASDTGSNFVDFPDYPLHLWNKSLSVNLTGLFLCSQEAIRLMIKTKTRGAIINTASLYGLVSPDQRIYESIKDKSGHTFVKPSDYATTKSGVFNFTRYLATMYGKEGIRVNTFVPGGVIDGQDKTFVKKYSQRTPLGRMAKKSDYNGAIVFLCSDASSYMTGSTLVVDGGWTSW